MFLFLFLFSVVLFTCFCFHLVLRFPQVLFPVVYLSNSNLVDIKVNFDFNNKVRFIISSILVVVNSVYYDRKLCESELLELLSLRIGYHD